MVSLFHVDSFVSQVNLDDTESLTWWILCNYLTGYDVFSCTQVYGCGPSPDKFFFIK